MRAGSPDNQLLELREEGLVLLVLRELDIMTAGALAHHVHVAHRGPPAEIDLSGVVFIDASGLGMLARLLERWPSIRLSRPSARVQQVAALVGLERLFADG